MDIRSIRTDLGRALEQVDGLNVVTSKPGSVIAPAALLGSYTFNPHRHMTGGASLRWRIIMLVADSATGAMDDLDTFLSDSGQSVVAALEEFQSAYWTSVQVEESEDVQIIDVGGTSFIACPFPVEIFC